MPHGLWDLSSLTRDGTCSPSRKHRVLTTGQARKSQKKSLFLKVLIFHLGENEDSVTCDISIFALAARKLIAAIIDLLELSSHPCAVSHSFNPPIVQLV